MEDSIRALNTVRVQANQTDGRVDNVEEDLEIIDNTVNEIESEGNYNSYSHFFY